MQFSMKSLAAAGVLAALASAPALAVDTPSTGNGSLFITIYDTTLGASVVQDLGLQYSDFVTGQATAAHQDRAFTVDLTHFTTVGSDFANLRYTVFAADALGNFSTTGMVGTAALNATIAGTSGNVVSMINNSSAVASSWNLNCGTDAVLCTGANFGSTYFGGSAWGDRFGSQLPVNGSGALGDALGFYLLTRTGIGSTSPLASQQFASANGVAQWLLQTDGSLRYTAPVPLPAALWMLLSGLAGLGVVSRRKGSNV